MPSTVVNFADVDSFEPLPEGSYDIEVDKVEVRKNKAGDGEYLNWELVVIDGEYENRRLWMITSLKPQALFRLKQVFDELGIIDEDDEEMELEWDDDIDPTSSGGPRMLYPELEGLEAVAQVKNEMYDGRERNRVENLFGAGTKKKTKKRAVAKTSTNGSDRSRRDKDEDEDDRSRSSRRSKRDEEDDEPRSRSTRRRSRDDDDEPKSRNRGRKDEDEDEDDDDEDEEEEERPRRRSSASTRTRSRSNERARRRVR